MAHPCFFLYIFFKYYLFRNSENSFPNLNYTQFNNTNHSTDNLFKFYDNLVNFTNEASTGKPALKFIINVHITV